MYVYIYIYANPNIRSRTIVSIGLYKSIHACAFGTYACMTVIHAK